MIRALLIWICMAGGALAQDIVIQAGEHPDFTRLSLLVGVEAGWHFGRTEGGYGLRLDDQRDFATSRIFDAVPRDRIVDIRHAPGRLDLVLACTCHASVFRHEERWLVIDIADGAPAPDDPAEHPVDPPRLVAPARGLPVLLPEDRSFFLLPGGLSPTVPRSPDPRAVTVGRDMAEAIAAAAGRGLLDLAGAPPDEPLPAASPQPQEDATPLLPVLPPGLPGIAAHDASLRAARDETAQVCPDPAAFEPAGWIASGDFGTEIGAGWLALTDGRDRFVASAAEDLARRYIAFGFGREAEQVLALAPQASLQRDRLIVLARVVDGRDVDPHIFARANDCPGPLSLWSALGVGTVHDLTEPGRTAAVIALRRLPAALQAQLTPRLADAFAAAGDPLAARELLEAAGGPVGTDEVDIALAGSDPVAARDQLADIVGSDPRLPADDLVRLVDLSVTTGAAVSDQARGLIEAARFEHRGTPEALDLATAEIAALVTRRDYSAALQLAAQQPATDRSRIEESVLLALARVTDSTVFAETYFAADLAPLTPAAGNALGERLIAEGFPDVALDLLGSGVTGAAQAERRYLRAAAAAALGRPDLVEAELLGLDDPRAEAIRARVPAEATASLAAWRRGAWPDLRVAEDALLAAAAEARLATPTLPDPAAPLAGRTALLADSAATAQLARDLLARFAGE